MAPSNGCSICWNKIHERSWNNLPVQELHLPHHGNSQGTEQNSSMILQSPFIGIYTFLVGVEVTVLSLFYLENSVPVTPRFQVRWIGLLWLNSLFKETAIFVNIYEMSQQDDVNYSFKKLNRARGIHHPSALWVLDAVCSICKKPTVQVSCYGLVMTLAHLILENLLLGLLGCWTRRLPVPHCFVFCRSNFKLLKQSLGLY